MYCQWNPEENRIARNDDSSHHNAECYYIPRGTTDIWYLCRGCATLPQFTAFRDVGKIWGILDFWAACRKVQS
jgi:hypothetical protein